MWLGRVSSSELADAGRWTVAFFSADTASDATAFPLIALREVVEEKKATVDPTSIQSERINYLGLENIRSFTGELVDFESRHPSEIKSRSKTFACGDVLYGRLRPELNKVYLAEPEVSPGICSSEFLVFGAIEERIVPRYLRYVLASPYVASFAQKLRSGASLPRLSAADLLELRIPLPPLSLQNEFAESLEHLDLQLRFLRKKLDGMPAAIMDAFTTSLRGGQNQLPAVEEKLREATQ
jgi:restriction endonuclease S subunit